MALRKELVLNWAGKEVKILITMAVIDRIENHINLGVMVSRCSKGDIRFSHAAKLIALLLNEGGCKVTPDEVYDGMFGADVTIQQVGEMLSAIFTAIFPEPKKKSHDQVTSTAKTPATKRRTRGTRSTS